MKKLLQKIDWVLVIRMSMGIAFIAIAIVYHDWMPAIFGIVMMVVAVIGSITKTGCGYGNCNYTPRYTSTKSSLPDSRK